MFGNIEVENHIFHQHKSSILINNVNIDRIVVFNKVPFGENGFKYFIRYKDDSKKIIEDILMKLNISIF